MRTSGLAAGLVSAAPGWILRAAAQATGRRKVLVAVFQRGAADGLNIVVPYFEPRYYEMRPTIAVQRPGTSGSPSIAIDLDGRFGLHPQLQPLKSLWDSRQLAMVHAAGSPDPSRSHFDAQEYMESGTPGVKSDDGWLNRALPTEGSNVSPMRAVAMSTQVPRTLKGSRGAIAMDDIPRFQLGAPPIPGIIEQLYAATPDERLKAQGLGTFEAVRTIDALRARPYTPSNGAAYQGEFGRRLQQIARLIKADVGVEVAFAEIGGWDHHVNESGVLGNVLREFGASLAAFARDLGDRMEDVVVVTMSEFGRTMAENGSQGTDHGHGGVMMVLGGAVNGGTVYGRWPGLEREQLFESRDLAVTTDFRDVLGELVRGHLAQNVDHVFPGYTVNEAPGLLRV
jgi:uncharacterized protein (DUF1501 family)